jgi:hypothetical protein
MNAQSDGNFQRDNYIDGRNVVNSFGNGVIRRSTDDAKIFTSFSRLPCWPRSLFWELTLDYDQANIGVDAECVCPVRLLE